MEGRSRRGNRSRPAVTQFHTKASIIEKKGSDVNRDGLLDRVCSFSVRASALQNDSLLGILAGQMIDETPLQGQDSVRIVK